MNNWLSYSLAERKAMLQATAEKEHIPDYAVEKDWWGDNGTKGAVPNRVFRTFELQWSKVSKGSFSVRYMNDGGMHAGFSPFFLHYNISLINI